MAWIRESPIQEYTKVRQEAGGGEQASKPTQPHRAGSKVASKPEGDCFRHSKVVDSGTYMAQSKENLDFRKREFCACEVFLSLLAK